MTPDELRKLADEFEFPDFRDYTVACQKLAAACDEAADEIERLQIRRDELCDLRADALAQRNAAFNRMAKLEAVARAAKVTVEDLNDYVDYNGAHFSWGNLTEALAALEDQK